MKHPQPAVDFLTSTADALGGESPEVPFGEWYLIDGIDAERGDDIRDYPEVWDTRLELPEILCRLSPNEHVAAVMLEGTYNLNALAIGLGLDRAQYEPKKFSGLLYEYEDGATVVIYGSGLCIGIGGPDKGEGDAVRDFYEKIEMLGLRDEVQATSMLHSGPVRDLKVDISA
ncbi:hypothetical protein [Halorubrum sp. Ea1]|uniref:hypothetical protein n=1 Tax=Halorubrum sp. Ea1 TaxID=1480718 RepID=UPI0011403B7D|nr:hypothetical protein [Halorubrum sp. Ea1]